MLQFLRRFSRRGGQENGASGRSEAKPLGKPHAKTIELAEQAADHDHVCRPFHELVSGSSGVPGFRCDFTLGFIPMPTPSAEQEVTIYLNQDAKVPKACGAPPSRRLAMKPRVKGPRASQAEVSDTGAWIFAHLMRN